MDKKFYSFENKTDTSADLYIYGDITSYEWDESDVSAWGFKKELEELGEISELNVHINSYGGETFQGYLPLPRRRCGTGGGRDHPHRGASG